MLDPLRLLRLGGEGIGTSLVSLTGYSAGKIRTVTYRKDGSVVLLAKRTGLDTLRKGRVQRLSQRVVGRDIPEVDNFLNSGWH